RLRTACRQFGLSPTCTVSGGAAVLAVALSLGAVGSAQQQQQPQPPQQQTPSPSGLGRAPTRAELQAWDISVGPDGAELPTGSGNASQGALVFTQRGCSNCHGPTGKEGPAPVLVGRKSLPS